MSELFGVVGVGACGGAVCVAGEAVQGVVGVADGFKRYGAARCGIVVFFDAAVGGVVGVFFDLA